MWNIKTLLCILLLININVGMNVMGFDDENFSMDLFDISKVKPAKDLEVEGHMERDFPQIVDCGPDESQNWFEPDMEDCSCYFVCTGRFYVHRRCSQGLLFDPTTGDCNWPKNVDCGDRPEPWAQGYINPYLM